ncbi:polyphosphate polymerase domain-containing protein [Saccharicrinis fermentans]|uniref:VTC domain protein n=1 Tax=Saccharicrinis fermentans DSM 9555 = JCM 21142 TaxID=869213 RepID=W7Y0X4_9BACT|nr:polyphosphate polymerase domain-containing protein [Saccharicrinis fermentans]GAF01602.1 VTC domain protein [Saccharicrinis fermentans DSM 9555 = JCM 21142]
MKINIFDSIQLREMEKVKLMNRVDKKYWFHVSRLSALLEEINESYFLLDMDGQSLLPYSTVYFDTPEDRMFIAHHNGKLNRYKIRRRSYVSSGISFFEVKFKNNKGRTIKKRIPSDFMEPGFSSQEIDFIHEMTPFCHQELKRSLVNHFSRLTLVNKNFKERCTIDLNLQFQQAQNSVGLGDLAIVEVKSDGRSSVSPLLMALRNQRIKPAGFSKYCVGRAITNRHLKRNAFKEKIRSIEKVLHTENRLYN